MKPGTHTPPAFVLGTALNERNAEEADVFAFLFDQLGMQ